jgi:hypothetical protein
MITLAPAEHAVLYLPPPRPKIPRASVRPLARLPLSILTRQKHPPDESLLTEERPTHAESVPLSDLAERFGTPCYVYSRAALEAAFDEFLRNCTISTPMSAMRSRPIRTWRCSTSLPAAGAGFDIVSPANSSVCWPLGLTRARDRFFRCRKITRRNGLRSQTGILCFNVESAPELERLNEVAGITRPPKRQSACASTPTLTPRRIRIFPPGSRRTSSAWPTTMR